MQLQELVDQVEGFDGLPPRDKIRLFAWWLHAHNGVEHFNNDAIRDCYRAVHVQPDQIATYLGRMIEKGDLVKERPGLKLSRAVRAHLDAKHGIHQSVVQVSKILSDLVGKVPDMAEKNFLAEAIKCYRVEAYRACVVMTWNLAYSHLLQWILNDPGRLKAFNEAIQKRYQKRTNVSISTYDGFSEEFKESEVIEVCSTASLLNSEIIRILREKLGKRNSAAHPASVVIVQSQADDVITDLINNVVVALT